MSNKRTVFIVQNDARKDYTPAEQYGELKDIFGNVGFQYNTDAMMAHARRVLSKWQPGDSILMSGDPTLCGIALAVASEMDEIVFTLNWDNRDFQYIRRRWDFGPNGCGVYPAEQSA